MKEADRRYNEEAVSADQVSVNSADPLHSTFRGNYEYAFGVVMFESAPRPDCRFAGSAKHLFAKVNYIREMFSLDTYGA